MVQMMLEVSHVSTVVILWSEALTMWSIVVFINSAVVVCVFVLVVVVGLVMMRMACLCKRMAKGFLCSHVLLQIQQGKVGACNILPIADKSMLPIDGIILK